MALMLLLVASRVGLGVEIRSWEPRKLKKVEVDR